MSLVLVCQPFPEAIEYANSNRKKYLSRKETNPDEAILQHEQMVSQIKKMGINTLDLRQILTPQYLDSLDLETKSNLNFVRDPFIATAKGIVLGKMKQKVRRKEVDVWATAFFNLGIKPLYRINEVHSFLEGGDYLLHQNVSYLEVGKLTSFAGALEAMQNDLFGTPKVVLLYSLTHDKDPTRIHLDCYFTLVGKKCLAWEPILSPGNIHQRFIIEFVKKNGFYFLNSRRFGIPLKEYLKREGFEIISISDDQQKRYATNLLQLPNSKLLVETKEPQLQNSIYINFDEIEKMWGGLHCSVQII